ncbi:MAG: hypothetical protein V9E83_13400 [Baekduia sp.]
MSFSRLVPAVLSVAVLGGGLSACGEHPPKNVGHNEGAYVETGGLEYQVQISRQLNPSDFEDRDYLVGLPAGTRLAKGEQYFAIFLRVFNREDEPARAARGFYMTDTTGARYKPIVLDTRINRVAFRPGMLNPSDQLPLPGSLGRENTTQGALILFKVPVAAYDSRPLTFHIEPPSGGEGAEVTLDV